LKENTMTLPLTIEWIANQENTLLPGHLRILDQTRLPLKIAYIDTDDLETVWCAIKTLQVRGAPAIGVTAAFGAVAAIQHSTATSMADFSIELDHVVNYLASSRPTAVNLFWALERIRQTAQTHAALSVPELKQRLICEAIAIRNEDAAMCRSIGEHGATLLKDGDTVLTHCNAGSLATAEFGTALAPVYVATSQNKRIAVYADETRPLLQGARLTAWELMQAGIDVTLICDNMAAQVMKEGRINAVMVGADRIAANGDAANKIGTYGVALLARAHQIPFYVLAPSSTIDLATPDGSKIPIEERGPEEVTCGFGKQTAPDGVKVYSPAFDVTPAALITAIICEKGIIRPDYTKNLRSILK
jgi:methylthioribose-1-phosphate isomerase